MILQAFSNLEILKKYWYQVGSSDCLNLMGKKFKLSMIVMYQVLAFSFLNL